MAQTNTPSIIPTAHVPNFRGGAPISANVQQQVQPYYQQRPLYGAPSWVSATAVYRQHVVQRVGTYTEHPDWGQFDHTVIWLGANTNAAYAPALGSSVAAQKARTFGGTSPAFYQAVKAPSISDVSRYMGGVINGR